MISQRDLRAAVLLITVFAITHVTSQQTRNCQITPKQVASSAVDTRTRLRLLRDEMKQYNQLKAYLISPKDAHQSEYTADGDMMLQYMSGFDGYEGLGIVTQDEAFLWVPDKYTDRTEELVDCNWKIMTPGSLAYMTPEDWLYNNIQSGSGVRVGADFKYLSYAEYQKFTESLQDNVVLNDIGGLVTYLWEEETETERPPRPNGPLTSLSLDTTGASWLSKVADIRAKMVEKDIGVVVLTDLADVAWLFNLRGSDIPYNPLFYSYAIIKPDTVNLYVDEHRAAETGLPECPSSEGSDKSSCVTINFYFGFMSDLAQLAAGDYGTLWMEEITSYAVVESVKNYADYIIEVSPVKELRSRKNKKEQATMEKVLLQDSVAVCEFMHWLEKEAETSKPTELSAMNKLREFRENVGVYKGESIPPISAFGSHTAIVDHRPTPENDMTIGTSGFYLFDSGAQFEEGLTDNSRTLYFGTPSEEEMMAYTRVVIGLIDLALAVFPEETYGRDLDFLARTPLWKAGMSYPHPTGHGFGMVAVHEDPIRLAPASDYSPEDEIPMQTNMYVSNEPGYYKKHSFGIRIEVIMKIVEAGNLSENDPTQQLMKFQTESLAPLETGLIDLSLMNPIQLKWYNDYHKRVLDIVGAELIKLEKSEVHEWLKTKTKRIEGNAGLGFSVGKTSLLVLDRMNIFACFLFPMLSLIL